MTWAKLSDDFCDHPILLGLPRGVRLLHVEATVWSCKHETDGAIPSAAPPRFTDEPDVDIAVAALVEVGLWEVAERGWQLVDFHKAQRRSADIAQDRYEAAERQARARAHREGDHSECLRSTFCAVGTVVPDDIPSRRHKNGDHSLCLVDDCPLGRVTRDLRRDLRRRSREPDPTRPDPTPKEGRGGKGQGTTSPARMGSQARKSPRTTTATRTKNGVVDKGAASKEKKPPPRRGTPTPTAGPTPTRPLAAVPAVPAATCPPVPASAPSPNGRPW